MNKMRKGVSSIHELMGVSDEKNKKPTIDPKAAEEAIISSSATLGEISKTDIEQQSLETKQDISFSQESKKEEDVQSFMQESFISVKVKASKHKILKLYATINDQKFEDLIDSVLEEYIRSEGIENLGKKIKG